MYRAAGFLLFCLLVLFPPQGLAQAYPAKPIRIVVPFPAGGVADVYSRIIGARLTETWGQPVVIENRTGAGGNIGAEAVAKSDRAGPSEARRALLRLRRAGQMLQG